MKDPYVRKLTEQWHLLMDVMNFQDIEERYARLHALSTLEIGVVRILNEKPDVIFREICEHLKIPKSTLTNIIDRLEKKNYVQRIINHRDRRSFGLILTEEGRNLQQIHNSFEYEISDRIINSLPAEEDKVILIESINKVISGLKNRE